MEEILNNLQPMVQLLSETFCVSVETIQSNLPEYLRKFADFCIISDCINYFIISVLTASVVGLVVWCAAYMLYDRIVYGEGYNGIKSIIFGLKVALPIAALIIIIVTCYPLSRYLISPELYGAVSLINLING